MSSAWEQIITAGQQIGEAFPHLPLVCFTLGSVAALWLLRRNLLTTRYDGRRELACFRTRSRKAHADIDQISAREWYARFHRARQFSRTGQFAERLDGGGAYLRVGTAGGVKQRRDG